MRRLLLLTLATAAGLSCGDAVGADAWPRFRGPHGAGQSDAAGIPAVWTDADYAWRVALPGLGHSSPVVWNGRVFVTSADRDSAELYVACFDLATGRELWQRRLPGGPHAMHRVNSYATSTPAVDDRHLYVAWKAGDAVLLAALTHEGRDVWQRQTGRLDETHGFGASPIVVGDVVCLPNDTDAAADSAIVGVDRRTGEILWRSPCGSAKTSYATPLAWETPDGETLILAASMSDGLTAYRPDSGAVAWNALKQDLPDRCVSSPVAVDGRVFVSCGSGNNGLHLIALQLHDASRAPTELYRLRQNIPNIPTPVAAGDLLVLWHDRGVVTCVDPASGAVHWRERIGGNFHSSPLRIGDRIYGISLTGEVVVLAAESEFKIVARHELGEGVVATPAVADGRLIIRTEGSLLCLESAP